MTRQILSRGVTAPGCFSKEKIDGKMGSGCEESRL